MGSGLFSFPGGHFGVGRFARGKGTQSYEARFSPSRSPFPGTSLFCVVVCYNVLENACMLLYWPCTAVPMGIHRTEGGLHSRPVPGNCYIAGAHLLLPVVVFLVLTCFCLLAYCWCLPASACWRIAGAYLLLPVGVLLMFTCFCLLAYHWHRSASANNREQARCAGRFPVRRNKKIGSA